jgi:hypothetical protein
VSIEQQIAQVEARARLLYEQARAKALAWVLQQMVKGR